MSRNNQNCEQPELPDNTPVIYIVLAWTFVTIPLGWGVYEVVVRSLPLFTGG
jgi:hypothetical protein